jgi:hypothetical protein
MKTRIIHTKIHFEDDWFNTLPIGFRYIFIYLFTNEHIGLTGAYRLSKRVALLETGATEKEWDDAITKFQKDDRVLYIDGWICVKNAGKHADYSGGKNEIAYRRELASIPKEIRSKIDSVSIQYLYPMDTTRNHKSEIINKKSEDKRKLFFDEKKQIFKEA